VTGAGGRAPAMRRHRAANLLINRAPGMRRGAQVMHNFRKAARFYAI